MSNLPGRPVFLPGGTVRLTDFRICSGGAEGTRYKVSAPQLAGIRVGARQSFQERPFMRARRRRRLTGLSGLIFPSIVMAGITSLARLRPGTVVLHERPTGRHRAHAKATGSPPSTKGSAVNRTRPRWSRASPATECRSSPARSCSANSSPSSPFRFAEIAERSRH